MRNLDIKACSILFDRLNERDDRKNPKVVTRRIFFTLTILEKGAQIRANNP